MEKNKNLDSNIAAEREGEMTVFLGIHLQRRPVSHCCPQTTMLRAQSVETHVAENPKNRQCRPAEAGNPFLLQ